MALLREIRQNLNIRRLFGKRELVIIEKQLLGVPLKRSERTRLSRDIRKKLEAIKELAQFASEFKLKKGAEIAKLVNDAKEAILESRYFSRIKQIVLFGSAVENTLTLMSDIDIAVEFTATTLKEATQFRKEMLGRMNSRIDLQVYNVLPTKIKREINKKGKILYEQQDQK